MEEKERKNRGVLADVKQDGTLGFVINEDGSTDIVGDEKIDDHAKALEKYLKKNNIPVMSFEECEKKYSTKKMTFADYLSDDVDPTDISEFAKESFGFTEYSYGHYLTYELNRLGKIFVRDYSAFSTSYDQAIIFAPIDENNELLCTKDQEKVLKSIEDNNDIRIDYVGYRNLEDAIKMHMVEIERREKHIWQDKK